MAISAVHYLIQEKRDSEIKIVKRYGTRFNNRATKCIRVDFPATANDVYSVRMRDYH